MSVSKRTALHLSSVVPGGSCAATAATVTPWSMYTLSRYRGRNETRWHRSHELVSR